MVIAFAFSVCFTGYRGYIYPSSVTLLCSRISAGARCLVILWLLSLWVLNNITMLTNSQYVPLNKHLKVYRKGYTPKIHADWILSLLCRSSNVQLFVLWFGYPPALNDIFISFSWRLIIHRISVCSVISGYWALHSSRANNTRHWVHSKLKQSIFRDSKFCHVPGIDMGIYAQNSVKLNSTFAQNLVINVPLYWCI